jgi:hypothetical protein
MISKYEKIISRGLRSIIDGFKDGAQIEESREFSNLLTELEFYLPGVLGEVHKEWKYEGLDGILPIIARKIGPGEIEIIGSCILISDQTMCGGPGLTDSWRAKFYAAAAGALSASY